MLNHIILNMLLCGCSSFKFEYLQHRAHLFLIFVTPALHISQYSVLVTRMAYSIRKDDGLESLL